MAATFPVLGPRTAISVALNQVWPGTFWLERRPHGFDITLTHAALRGSVTVAIDDKCIRPCFQIDGEPR